MVFPDVEFTKLSDLVSLMKSSDEGLTMLKNGSAAGRELIKETVEKGLSETAQTGLKALRGILSKDGLAATKEKLVTLNVARVELMARINKLIANSSLLSDTKKVLSTAKNSIKDHLTQDDLIGALRDILGKEVRRSGDGYTYQHLREVRESLSSLDNAVIRLTKEIDKISKGTAEYSQMSKEIDAIKEMKRRVLDFLKTK